MTVPKLIRISYLSSAAQGVDTGREIEAILAASRRNNARSGVTGALIFNRGTFGQILEGPDEAVDETFARIEADPRHDRIEVLALKKVDARAFADWSMGFVGRPSSMTEAVEARRTTFDLSSMDGDEMFATLHRIALGRDSALRIA